MFQVEDRDMNREQLQEEVRGLKNILSVAQVVVSSLDLDEVLQNILCSAMAIMDMPAGSIALYDEPQNQMSLHAHAGLSPAFVSRNRWTVRHGGLTHHILEEGKPYVVEDARGSDLLQKSDARAEGICSLIAVPLKFQEKIVGILYLDDFRPRTHSCMRLQALSILASFAIMSIDHARLHAATRQLAWTDGLTGLYNYRMFRQMVREELIRTERYRKPMSLILFDIDDFKPFNDTYGHPAGDKALVAVTEIMRESLRECDILFRYGGEEFVALLPETDIGEALIAAERARSAVETNSGVMLRAISPKALTVSVGVAAYPRDGRDLDTLLKTVDDLMYKAKKCGKNKVYHLGGERRKGNGRGEDPDC